MAAPNPRADPVARARLLARVREAVLSGSPAPEQPRPVVSESWRRSLAARINPERGRPPSVFKPREVAELRAGHPLAETLPVLRETLVAIADEAMHMMIVTDARGHILWREGHNDVLHLADEVGLTEGTRWSEDAIGTNAMGTALASGRAVQIHASEHLVRAYHAWTCAASPVRDPDTGEIVGVVDVTGPMRTFHPSTAALVAAAAKLAEAQLNSDMRQRDERLRTRCATHLAALGGELGALLTPTGRVLASAPLDWLPARLTLPDTASGSITLPDGRSAICEPLPGGYLLRLPAQRGGLGGRRLPGPVVGVPPAKPSLELRFLGAERPLALLDGRELRLTQRHADMLVLLALAPSGLSAEQLATGVYGERGNPVTARAEIHRLRAQLGTAAVRSNPYRLHAEVSADFRTVRAELRAGRVREATTAYRGELLPASEAPAVIELREVLFGELRRATLDRRDPEAMWSLADTPAGADDVELAEELARALPRSDPRHAAILARLDSLLS
jgi:hypothetical protein